MKYVIILKTRSGSYIVGFTNEPILEESPAGERYTVELRELNNISIKLEGDAAVYLS